MKNKLIIASAGSGKTTLLVKEALKADGGVLLTTYTEANETEIRKKIIEINGFIPNNITIQTWFSFLLQHGAKPYQGTVFKGEIKGFLLVTTRSGLKFPGTNIYYGEEENLKEFYFSKSMKMYSDKVSKFVIRCNEKSNGEVISRLSRIYSYVFVDEVQDLAGYDLEFLILLFKSQSKVILAGDPRQVTYLTNHSAKHPSYRNGQIKKFVNDKCKKLCTVDEETLKFSHRNNKMICEFSSLLYPNYCKSAPCSCEVCRDNLSSHNGIFLVKKGDVDNYKNKYSPIILKYNNAVDGEWNYGKSKGLGFDRVLIYPTESIVKYLKDGLLTKLNKKKEVVEAFDIAKFYVAVTRAKYSVAIVHDYDEGFYIGNLQKWVKD
jgi:DNA helicase-2/ATP-dependent DNA helicase PcrA